MIYGIYQCGDLRAILWANVDLNLSIIYGIDQWLLRNKMWELHDITQQCPKFNGGVIKHRCGDCCTIIVRLSAAAAEKIVHQLST